MVSEGRGRLFRRKDGKYLIDLPKDLAEDSMFPFKGGNSIFVNVSFKLKDDKLLIEKCASTRRISLQQAVFTLSLFCCHRFVSTFSFII
jgi:hypothetical protein